ncbi:amidase [Frankia sp. AgB1.9]|uniref:amidase n=1 Tax=unclassified Frankia TaxID=2632575 RepID=UPI001933BAB1|nr:MULTISPECIES: amidase [unclassified Frankia]MBL7490430.1 amidase [Frankia sp. AgW1.1]MBL7550066.1 amidase [Frankia sp. AgB1.9]MBL7624623.1 amidase [Frankia sp. AgB1.8]
MSTPADGPPESAAQIAADVRSGRRSAVEVLETHAARAAASDLNAIVTPLWEPAHAAAKRLDGLDPGERGRLPLAGVPVTVKDIICVAGAPTTAGGFGWDDRAAAADASAVASLRAAGALIVGKTNLPELAFGTVTDNARFGATANPLSTAHSPGGSSGGEAAAIAAGLSAAGLGGDFGGSIRWPAQCTGIVGLRATVGRVPGTGQVPGAGGELGDRRPPLPDLTGLQGRLQVIGPMARRVEDLRLLLSVIARPDGIDPRVRDLPVPAPAGIDRLIIGWSTGASIAPVRREVADLMAHVAGGLASLCAAVVALPDVFAECFDRYREVRALTPNPDHFAALSHLDRVPADVLAKLIPPPGPDPDRLARAERAADEARSAALAVFDLVDVVILPVAPGPACDPDDGLDVDGVRVEGPDLMAHCRAVSLLGVPVVSVPVGVSAEGLPLSVQVIAAPWKEHLALDVAAELEVDRDLGAAALAAATRAARR